MNQAEKLEMLRGECNPEIDAKLIRLIDILIDKKVSFEEMKSKLEEIRKQTIEVNENVS